MAKSPKPKFSITADKLLRLALPLKSRKYKQKFHRWYELQICQGRYGRKPTDEEFEKHLIEAQSYQYDAEVSKREIQQMQSWLPRFESETRPKFATNVNPSDFPMRFKECLRRVIGGRNYGYNLPIFKKFYRHYLKSIAVKNGYPSYEQSDEYIETRVLEFIEWFKTNRIDKGFFTLFSTEIPIWRMEHRIKPQRKDAANSRWLKENRKKLLVILIQRINELSHRQETKKVKVRMKKMSISHRKKSEK